MTSTAVAGYRRQPGKPELSIDITGKNAAAMRLSVPAADGLRRSRFGRRVGVCSPPMDELVVDQDRSLGPVASMWSD